MHLIVNEDVTQVTGYQSSNERESRLTSDEICEAKQKTYKDGPDQRRHNESLLVLWVVMMYPMIPFCKTLHTIGTTIIDVIDVSVHDVFEECEEQNTPDEESDGCVPWNSMVEDVHGQKAEYDRRIIRVGYNGRGL